MIQHRYLLAVEFTSDILFTWIELMKLDGSWKFIDFVIFSTLVEWLTLSTCTMGVVVVVVVVVGQTVWPISSNQLLAKQLIASQATSP